MSNTEHNPDIFIKSYGCASNRFDAQEAAFSLADNGFFVYKQPFGSDRKPFHSQEESIAASKAAYFIIYTCPLTRNLEELTIDFIKKARRINKKAKVVLTGCSLKSGVSALRSNISKGKGVLSIECDDIAKYFLNIEKKKDDTGKINISEPAAVLIKRGCSKRCSYCVCPSVYKKPQSMSVKDIMRQAKYLESRGFRSIEFAGSCIGDWRQPHRRDFKFADLLSLILKQTRFKIVNLEMHPRDIDDKLLEILKNSRIEKEISIPMQSASDRMLKLMNRRYDAMYVEDLFAKLFTKFPDIILTTDIILGYPGERKKDIDSTIRALEKYPISRVDIYRYSSIKERPHYFKKTGGSRESYKNAVKLIKKSGLKKIANFTSL